MPASFHIDRNQGLLTLQAHGEVTLHGLVSVGRRMLADRRYDAAMPQLLDLRGMRVVPAPLQGAISESVPVSGLDLVRRFVHGPYRERTAGSVAVVIDQHLESAHCADIYLLTCAVPGAELFADYQLALKWLMRQELTAIARV